MKISADSPPEMIVTTIVEEVKWYQVINNVHKSDPLDELIKCWHPLSQNDCRQEIYFFLSTNFNLRFIAVLNKIGENLHY